MSSRAFDSEAVRVGRVLRAVREDQALTQVEVAAVLGKGEGAYAAYESGRSRFTLPELPAVARALKVDLAYLSRRLGLCGDDSDVTALLVEYAGPEIGQLIATAVAKYPSLDGDRRAIHGAQLQQSDRRVHTALSSTAGRADDRRVAGAH